MAERLNAHDSKSCYAGMYTRVQIPFSAPQKRDKHCLISFLFVIMYIERDLRVGAVLREQNALPCGRKTTRMLTAKDDVDNVGAGRAAKGANPFLCATKKR